MKLHVILMLLVLAAGTTTIQAYMPVQASATNAWEAHMAKADRLQPDCYQQKNMAACTELLANYNQALIAADSDEKSQIKTLDDMLNAYSAVGRYLREAGNVEAAFKVLHEGQKYMLVHYGIGEHRHILLDSTGIEMELIKTLWMNGQAPDAENLVAQVRSRETLLQQKLAEQACSKALLTKRFSVARSSLGFELALGSYYKKSAEALKEKGINPAREQQLLALSREAELKKNSWGALLGDIGKELVNDDSCKLKRVAVKLRPATQDEIRLLRKGIENKINSAKHAVFRNVTVGGGGYASTMCGQVFESSGDGRYDGFRTFYATLTDEPRVHVLSVAERYSDESSLAELRLCEKEARVESKYDVE